MTKVSNKIYLISAVLFVFASVACKIVYEFADRIVGDYALLLIIPATIFLLLTVLNLGYRYYQMNNQKDEFIKLIVMKATCFSALMTGGLSWFYSCLGSSVPQYQADWPYFMLLVFSGIGYSYFLRKAS